jgi:uncharacterized protein (DUF2062 family)
MDMLGCHCMPVLTTDIAAPLTEFIVFWTQYISGMCILEQQFDSTSRLPDVISMRLRAGQEVRFIAVREGLRNVSSTNLQNHHTSN